jgi:hypothetical protein
MAGEKVEPTFSVRFGSFSTMAKGTIYSTSGPIYCSIMSL